MKKKLLLTSLVICIGILLFGIINVSAATEGYFTYTVSNGEATISSCDKSASGTVVIPDTLGGYPVTTVGLANTPKYVFYDCNNITGLVFGKNVKTIGSYVTLGCCNISSISMTDSVTTISSYAFSNLDKLNNIILSKNIETMGSGILQGCDNLEWVVLSEKITNIPTDTFSRCASLQKVFVPQTVTQISYYSFQNCNNLTDVYFAGSQTQWNNINIAGSDKTILSNATIHYNIPSRYTISYNANGGSNAPLTQTKIYGMSTYLSSSKPTRYGHTFKNWNTNASGTGTTYNSGALYSANSSLTLYAQWTPNKYTVNYYTNDDKNLLIATSYHSYGVSRTLFKNTYVREGYRFLGWGTSKNSTTVKYADEETVLNLSTTNGGVINLYAVWEVETYTITYDANGGENAPVSHTVMAFTDTYLALDIPVREGYKFVGWSEDAEADTAQYQSGDTITVETSDITLYAVWEKAVIIIQSGTCGPNARWILDSNGVLTISGTGYMYNYGGGEPWNDYKSDINTIVISNGITEISSGAFERASNLSNIYIGSDVEKIGNQPFYDCINLKNVYIEDLKKWCEIEFWSMDANPLYYAENLYLNNILVEEIIFSSDIETIGGFAFYKYEKLKSIVLPENIKSIGPSAFNKCTSLANITFLAIPENISPYSFYELTGLENIYITDIEKWCTTDFPINASPICYAENLYLNNELVTDLNIPGNIEKIGNSVFYKYKKLRSVRINEGTTTIGEYTFYGCTNLETVVIPKSIKVIDSWAFYECENIEAVHICDLTAWCQIEFKTQTSNPIVWASYLYLNGDLVENLEIPISVTYINDYAFSSCQSLKSVTLHGNVVSIGKRAFYFCQRIENTYYYGTEAKWNQINIGNENEYLTRYIKYIYPHTKTTVSEDKKTLTVNPVNVDAGKTVIVALYNGGQLVETQSAICKSETLEFTTTKEYDTIKIMVWQDLTDLVPITEPENI